MGGKVSPQRIVAAAVSGGTSEIAKAIPGKVAGVPIGSVVAPLGALANAGSKALFPTIPKPNLGTIGTENQELAAKNAVQTQEAEARRARAAKRISSVLTGGLGLPGSAPTASATLQPNEARKTVLG